MDIYRTPYIYIYIYITVYIRSQLRSIDTRPLGGNGSYGYLSQARKRCTEFCFFGKSFGLCCLHYIFNHHVRFLTIVIHLQVIRFPFPFLQDFVGLIYRIEYFYFVLKKIRNQKLKCDNKIRNCFIQNV